MERVQPIKTLQVSRQAIKVDRTPNDLSEYTILMGQLFIVFLIGNTSNSSDALQQLLYFFGALDVLKPDERLIVVHHVTGVAISCTFLFSYPVQLIFCRLLGPRYTCLVGIVFHFLGYFFLFGTTSVTIMNTGVIFLAISSCCILCSSLNIACQFPKNVNVILCAIGVVYELSPMVAQSSRFFLSTLGSNLARSLLPFLTLGKCLLCIIIAIRCLPMRAFRPPIVISQVLYRASPKKAKDHGLGIAIEQFLGQTVIPSSLPKSKLQSVSYDEPASYVTDEDDVFLVNNSDEIDVKQRRQVKSQSFPGELNETRLQNDRIPIWNSPHCRREFKNPSLNNLSSYSPNDVASPTSLVQTFNSSSSTKTKLPLPVTSDDINEYASRQDRLLHMPAHLRYDDYILLEDLGIYPNSLHYVPKKILPTKWRFSLLERFTTLEIWAFLPFFTFCFIRRKHFLVSLRAIFQENDEKDSYAFHWTTFLYLNGICLSSCFLLVWGYYVKRFGSAITIVISHITGTIGSACLASPIPIVRDLGMLPLLFHLPSVTGLAGAFCSDVFGFHSGRSTTGIITTIVGLISLIHDFVWPYYTIVVWQSFRYSNLCISALSGVMSAFPFALFLLSAIPEKEGFRKDSYGTYHNAVDWRMHQAKCHKLLAIPLEDIKIQPSVEAPLAVSTCTATVPSELTDRMLIPFSSSLDMGLERVQSELPAPLSKQIPSIVRDNAQEHEKRLQSFADGQESSLFSGSSSESSFLKDCDQLDSSQLSQEAPAIRQISHRINRTQESLSNNMGINRDFGPEKPISSSSSRSDKDKKPFRRTVSFQDDIQKKTASDTSHNPSLPLMYLKRRSVGTDGGEQSSKHLSILPEEQWPLLPSTKGADEEALFSGDVVLEDMYRTACQIKFFESLFPLLPMYEISSSTSLAEECVVERILDAWDRIPRASGHVFPCEGLIRKFPIS